MFRQAFRCFSRFPAPTRRLALGTTAAGLSGVALAIHSPPPIAAQEVTRPGTPLPRRILIDTDPGVDDAVALLLALGNTDKLQMEGLSIVCGNGPDVKEHGANAQLILRLAGVDGVPVSLGPSVDSSTGASISRGGDKPVRVHGDDCIGDVGSKYGRCEADFTGFHSLEAPEFIYDVCARAPGEITLICIGPLSNVAAALRLHPDLPELVREVLIMGGAFGQRRGNRSPAAEANFLDDPEAAQAVLNANFRRVVVAGLDVTHQTDVHELREACAPLNSLLARFVWDVVEHYIQVYRYFGESIAPAHDAVPVMYLLRPDIFESKHVCVGVETRGEFTRGMSIADWKGQWGKQPNCHVLTSVLDGAAFTKEFTQAIARLPLSPTPVSRL